MGFLVPLFLAGLAAVAVPILVHLTRKQRARVVEFPSLMFLEKVPFRAESRRRIQHWLLLALRALVVVLAAVAFARPFFRDADAAAVGGGGPVERVFLVDRSYSMSMGDHWDRGLDDVRSRIGTLGPLDRASIVFFAKGAHVAVRSSGDRSRLRAALDSAHPGAEATAYGPALKLARAILDESELGRGQVVLVSDFQRGGWTGEEGVTLPPGTEVLAVPLADRAPPDRAVAGVSLSRERVGGRERITPVARLVRTGGDAPEDVEVVLEVEGREIQRRVVTLPASGGATAGFDPFTLTERHTPGTVRFADADELAADDAYHFVLSPGRAISVLVLDGPRSGDRGSLYVRRALEITREGTFDVEVSRAGGVGPADLEGRRVVVVNDRSPGGTATLDALRRHVEAGGGLVVVLGERGSWPQSDAGLLPGTPGPVIDREGTRVGRLGHLDYDHPIFEIFQGPRSGDFTGARFFRSRSLDVPEADSVRVLARFDDGSVALAERRTGEGRVLVWTSTLDAFWNDLALQPIFLPFIQQMVRYAAGGGETVPAFTAGQVIDVTDARAMTRAGLGDATAAMADQEERVALTPGGGDVLLPASGEATFLHLDEQGFYRIRAPGDDETRPLVVAVNVELSESNLEPMDPQEVIAAVSAGVGSGGGLRAGEDPGRAARLQVEDRERRQSLWRYLLMAAFVLMAVETVLSNRITKATGGSGSHAHT